MKERNKILSILLTVVMAVSCLTGCGGKGQEAGKDYDPDAINVEISAWNDGFGVVWLEKMIEAFEKKNPEYNLILNSSADAAAVAPAFGMPELDKIDLYISQAAYNAEYMEPLDDIISTTLEGEAKTIGEKFDATYLEGAQAADGHYYMLSAGGGVLGLVYNKEIFKQAGIKQLPRTTDELVVVCDTLYSNGHTPLCHFAGGSYYTYLDQTFMIQYDGMDYFLNNFFACKDDEGNSPSIKVLTKKDGRYYALKAYEKFITPEYTLAGSNTKTHTEVQTEFLSGKAAMMVNGSWLEYEMRSTGGTDNFAMMRTPVLSAIVNKLTTVKTEKLLRDVIKAIDQVSDGEKQLSDFASGDGYLVNGTTVSAEDWQYVSAARNTVATNFGGVSAYIPTYSAEKEAAKEFLKFMYSDEGITIYEEEVHAPRPINLSTGEAVDTKAFSSFAQSVFYLTDSAEHIADLHTNKKHPIFLWGGAHYIAKVSFINKFCANNADDRLTADEAWELIIDTIEDNYEANWLKNIE